MPLGNDETSPKLHYLPFPIVYWDGYQPCTE